jgi:hypothetical protein
VVPRIGVVFTGPTSDESCICEDCGQAATHGRCWDCDEARGRSAGRVQ